MTALAAVIERDVVTASGPDAAAYLQGQISQDLDALDPGDSAWSFVLQPQGKVDAWFRLTRTGPDAFVLDVDAGHGEGLLARLQRFLLRTQRRSFRFKRPDLEPLRSDHSRSRNTSIASGISAVSRTWRYVGTTSTLHWYGSDLTVLVVWRAVQQTEH